MPIDRIVQLRRVTAIIARETCFAHTACQVEAFTADRIAEG